MSWTSGFRELFGEPSRRAVVEADKPLVTRAAVMDRRRCDDIMAWAEELAPGEAGPDRNRLPCAEPTMPTAPGIRDRGRRMRDGDPLGSVDVDDRHASRYEGAKVGVRSEPKPFCDFGSARDALAQVR